MTGQRKTRKVLATLGWRGREGYVRVVEGAVRGEDRAVVEWRDAHGRRQQQSFPRTRAGLADAKAFADTLHRELTATAEPEPVTPTLATNQPEQPATIRRLFDLYLAAHPVPRVWRPKTLEAKRKRWAKFELHADRDTAPVKVTRETLNEYVTALFNAGHSVNQIGHHVSAVRSVFTWGVEEGHLAPTLVTSYRARFGTDAQRQRPKMEEFTAEHRATLLASLDPKDAAGWRIYAFVALTGYAGPRANAALLLQWSDVDFEGGRVFWRPETDKRGNDRWQPVPPDVIDALFVAYGWCQAFGYRGPHVFFRPALATRRRDRIDGRWYTSSRRVEAARGAIDKPWTYSAAIGALHRAEQAAGLTPVKWKGFHAFRRGIAGDVYDATGSEKAAAEYLGDKSVTIVRESYLLEREDRLRKTAALVSRKPGGEGE